MREIERERATIVVGCLVSLLACSDEEILSFGIRGVNFGELGNREKAGESLFSSF